MADDKFSEAQLCDEFRAWARERGFLVYPEVSDWDLVLVPSLAAATPPAEHLWIRGALPEGCQFVVQAKLQANVDVLHQAVTTRGGNYRVVLVRRATPDFVELAAHLGLITVVRERARRAWPGQKLVYERADNDFLVFAGSSPKDWGGRPLPLPPIEADLPAGMPCPRQLTQWRVRALKLCRVLNKQGYLTTEDFKREGVNPQRWRELWLQDSGEKEGRLTRYVRRPGVALPDAGWEEISAQLEKAEEAKETP